MFTSLKALALVLLLLGGCAGATSSLSIAVRPSNGISEQIPATLMKPDGPGPFPAIVIMHDCSGLGIRSSGAPSRWATELVERGYVILIPDSFATRGYPSGVCTDPSPNRTEVAPNRRVHDAYAALAYLRSLPFVVGSRVGVMGGSHGGATTLASIVAPERDNEPLAVEKRAGFAAALALYPNCTARLGSWRTVRQAGAGSPITAYVGVYKPVASLLILIGEDDDWTPAEPCGKLAESARQAGYPVSIKIYPGAHHSFDSNRPKRYDPARVNGNSPTGRGATTAGNPQAWEDSIRQVTAFFGQHLMPAGK
jgi:dienelactone hydrolase